MGAECSPTPPGCRFGEACPAEELQTRSCINFCAPIWPGPDADRSGYCALDECDEDALAMPGVWRCPDGFACNSDDTTAEPERIGRCRSTFSTFLTRCAPPAILGPGFVGFTCSSGTFCMPLANCPERVRELPGRWTPEGSAGVCMLPAREGELCDGNIGDTDALACRACEWGTFCRDTTSGARCMRACADATDPSVARPDLCDCDTGGGCQPWASLAPPSPVFDVLPGEPEHYCTIPCVVNGTGCERTTCCDPLAQCSDAEDHAGIERLQCCRGPGSACTTDDDCCRGFAECIGGACMPCGREGAPVPQSTGCCRGYVPIEGVCRSCAASTEGRELARHGECEGHFVQLVDSDGRTDTFAAPVNGNTAAGPAEMPSTSGDVQRVRYQLEDDHRLFLLQGDLTGPWDRVPCAHPPEYTPVAEGECSPGVRYPAAGVTVGHRFVQLPANAPGGAPADVSLAGLSAPPSTWQSMRIYDSGACSQFLDWQTVADAAAAGVNRGLVDPPYTDAVRLDDNRVVPILASGSGLFARAAEQDQINIYFQYTAPGGAGECGAPTRIRLDTALALLRLPATLPTPESSRRDRDMLVGDLVPCRTPPSSGSCVETCRAYGERYLCAQYEPPDETGAWTHLGTAVYPRPVRNATDAFDFEPDLLYLNAGAVDCGWLIVSPILSGQIEGRIRTVFPRLLNELMGNLRVHALQGSLGLTFADLVDCGELDVWGDLWPNHGICAEVSPTLFGGRRHRCVGYNATNTRVRDAADATQYRCGELQMEVRRVNVRPDGLEFVLAEDLSDPQLAPLRTLPGNLCALDRPGSLPSLPPVPPVPATMGTTSGPWFEGLPQLLNPASRIVCSPGTAVSDASGVVTGCAGICGDLGVPCGGVYGMAFAATRGFRADEVNDLDCYVFDNPDPAPPTSECCHPDPPPAVPYQPRVTLCPRPRSAGGRQLLHIGATPAPSDYYACRNLDDDAGNCGACGAACVAGSRCCGGACADVQADSANCGACRNDCGVDGLGRVGICLGGVCAYPGEP